ncbi:MAG TPA: two-component regulator propeller domain-containing protein, partial [Balneolaceae bacterium]|nr:two-component regulator propeller domain-containing protein [Balneolaceae bacterium]
MLSILYQRVFLVVIFILPFASAAVEPGYSQEVMSQENGIYFHRQYMPSEHGGHTQSWAITQDDRGLVYIGNGDGLLEYDGVEWRMIEVAGGQVALSVDIGENNRLYVGSVNDFGVIQPDSIGRPIFRSLLQEVPEDFLDFEDVWETKAYSGGVVFRTRSAIFHMDYDDSLTIITPDDRYERIHNVGDDIYTVDLGIGLMKLENKQFVPVPDGDQFLDLSVWFMSERPDGSIFMATRSGTYMFDGDSIAPFETEIAPILGDKSVYHATEIEGKGYAFATIQGGVYITNYSGSVTDVIDRRLLTSNQATYVYSDRLNNLWVATTNGLNKVEISNPLTYFDETTGLSSGITDVAKHNGRLFVVSSSVAQYLDNGQGQTGYPEFITIPTPLTGFSLLENTEYGLLASSIYGLVEISDDSASAVLPEFEGIVVSQSASNPDQVLLGHRDGIAIFEHLDDTWVLLSTIDGVTEQVYTLAQDKDGIIWAGTDFQGLIRITPGEETKIDRFETEKYFNSGSASVYLADGEVVISTETGMYKPSDPWTKEKPFIPDVSNLLDEYSSVTGTLNIEEDVDSGYWVVTDGTVGFTPALDNPLTNLQEGALARLSSSGVRSILPDENGILWVANELGLIRYNSKSDYPGDVPFNAFVRGAFQNDKPIFGGMSDSSSSLTVLPYQQNDIRFLFGTNFIEDEDRAWYQVRLAGLDDDWTNWSNETFKDYTNIPHGSYDLEVRAMNTYNDVSTIGSYSFRILPPWWYSWWAYTFYSLIFFGGVYVVDKYQRRRLIKKERERARERELEQAKEIEKAYEELKAAKDQL